MKVAFLDRDGTICKDYPDKMWAHVSEPEMLDGSIQGLKKLISMSYELVLITNQYTIGEGIITLAQYQQFNERLFSLLNEEGIEFLDVFFCPHARNKQCDCCKPKRGMIDQALKKYPEINLQESIFVGDSWRDEQLAKNVGLNFYGMQRDCQNRIERLDEIQ